MPGEDARRLTGDIIEESLADRSVLSEVTILETRVEPATEYHRTPWLERWTIHRVAVPEERAAEVAERFSEALDVEHAYSLVRRLQERGYPLRCLHRQGFSGSPP
jgi:hypothetical protein